MGEPARGGGLLSAASVRLSSSRIALCVGVSQYSSSLLKNSANDARDVADALRSVGFKVTLLLEPDIKALQDGVDAFAASVRLGCTAVFFFAGAPQLWLGARRNADGFACAWQGTAAKRRTAPTIVRARAAALCVG
jgi:hypothetical protein